MFQIKVNFWPFLFCQNIHTCAQVESTGTWRIVVAEPLHNILNDFIFTCTCFKYVKKFKISVLYLAQRNSLQYFSSQYLKKMSSYDGVAKPGARALRKFKVVFNLLREASAFCSTLDNISVIKMEDRKRGQLSVFHKPCPDLYWDPGVDP